MKDILKYFDKITFVVLILITLSGILLIYSGSRTLPQTYHIKQLIWLAVSLIAFVLVFFLKTEVCFRYSLFMYGFLVVVLAIQIVSTRTFAGTKSWVKLGSFFIQFSEFVKIPLLLYLAKYLTTFRRINWKVFFRLIVIIGLPFLLIVLQPDLGVALILLSSIIVIILLRKIKPLIVVFSLCLLMVVAYGGWEHVLKPYQKHRIISFFNPEKYSDSFGYHVIQSRIAVGSGGLLGKGYLKGSQSQYQFLPTRHTDFIVSVLGEEFGFLGISFLFLLFFLLFYRQYNFKFKKDEDFYFIFLFNSLILFQFLINISMTVGLFPVLGVPLPFVSYGGSSLLSFFIGESLIFRMKINNYIS